MREDSQVTSLAHPSSLLGFKLQSMQTLWVGLSAYAVPKIESTPRCADRVMGRRDAFGIEDQLSIRPDGFVCSASYEEQMILVKSSHAAHTGRPSLSYLSSA